MLALLPSYPPLQAGQPIPNAFPRSLSPIGAHPCPPTPTSSLPLHQIHLDLGDSPETGAVLITHYLTSVTSSSFCHWKKQDPCTGDHSSDGACVMIGPYQSETFLRYRSIASTCQALAAACFKRPGTPRERMRSFDLVPTQTAPNTDDRDCRVKPQTPGPQALANSSPPDADGVSLHPWLSLSGSLHRDLVSHVGGVLSNSSTRAILPRPLHQETTASLEGSAADLTESSRCQPCRNDGSQANALRLHLPLVSFKTAAWA